MSDDTFSDLIRYLNNRYLQLTTGDRILVIFHGGEPFIADLNKMQILIDQFSSCENISFTATTNLTYDFDDVKICIMKKMKQISTSYDYKIRFTTLSQQQLWEKNIKCLHKLDIHVMPIITITKLLIDNVEPKMLYQYLTSIEINHVNFERLTLTGNAVDHPELMPHNKDIDAWMYQFYCIIKNDANFHVSIIDAISQAIKKHELVGCKCRQCQKNVTTINPDGTIAGCPNTADVLKLGDIVHGYDIEKYQQAQQCEQLKTNTCYLCKYFKYCNGECFQLQHDKTGCPGLISIMKDILDNE